VPIELRCHAGSEPTPEFDSRIGVATDDDAGARQFVSAQIRASLDDQKRGFPGGGKLAWRKHDRFVQRLGQESACVGHAVLKD
jgi:hypothetical protein